MPVKTSSASRGAKGAVHASKKHSDRTSRETARKPQHTVRFFDPPHYLFMLGWVEARKSNLESSDRAE
jgi:hypothetical protein